LSAVFTGCCFFEATQILYLTIGDVLFESRSYSETWERNKMNNQSKHSKEKLDSSIVPIVLTLNDVTLEERKKSATQPTYIDHL
jgi:hypothetical protein